jgi:hypothetical protein
MSSSSAAAPRYQSNLPSARERFLSAVVDFALAEGWRTPADFLRHFGPRTLIQGLAADPALRVRVLTATTRVNERLAARKTTASAAEDLSLALEEGLTDANKLLALIPPDDRVRHLDAVQLWAFLSEVEFWKGEAADPEERDRYVRRVTFLLEAALREGVLRLQDIADGIGFKRIASCLPRAELQRVVEHALSRAREGQRLTEEQLLEAVPLRSLMNHVPLEHTWNEVITARLARPMQFLRPSPEDAARPRRLPPPPPSRNKSSSKPGRFDPSLLPESLLELQRGLEQQSAPPPPLVALGEADLVQLSAEDSEETINVELATRVDVKAHREDDEQKYAEAASELSRVSAALDRMGRLPASDPELTLPILLSIESMYAELGTVTDPAERYSVIREAFPNQTHLRIALVALIALLDPAQRGSDALRDADGDLLIHTLLAQEQHWTSDDASSSLARQPLGQFN